MQHILPSKPRAPSGPLSNRRQIAAARQALRQNLVKTVKPPRPARPLSNPARAPKLTPPGSWMGYTTRALAYCILQYYTLNWTTWMRTNICPGPAARGRSTGYPHTAYRGR